MAHVLRILLRCGQADAGTAAAANLVLQARPGAVLEITVFTLTDAEQLLQDVEAVAHRAGAGKRSEVLTGLAFGTTVKGEPREIFVVREIDVRIRFIVPQHHVVRWSQRFDEALLQQQRFGFAGGDGGLDLINAVDQGDGLGIQPATAKIVRHPILEVAGFADVEHLPVGIKHLVDPGFLGQLLEEGLGVKCSRGHAATLVRTDPAVKQAPRLADHFAEHVVVDALRGHVQAAGVVAGNHVQPWGYFPLLAMGKRHVAGTQPQRLEHGPMRHTTQGEHTPAPTHPWPPEVGQLCA